MSQEYKVNLKEVSRKQKGSISGHYYSTDGQDDIIQKHSGDLGSIPGTATNSKTIN